MTRTRHRTTLLVVLVLLVAVLAGVSVTAAQGDETPEATATPSDAENVTSTPANDTNETATPTATPEPTPTETATETPEATATPTETPSNDSYLISIGTHGTARVVSQEWEDGELTFLLEVDRPQTITVTDASIDLQEYEARDVPQLSRRVPPGRTEITFTVEDPSDAAVTVGSSRGGLISLSPGNAGLFNRGSQWADVRAAGAGAGTGGLIALLGGVWYAVTDRRVVGVEVVDQEETRD